MAYSLPDLPYAYDALEPHIDERTMRIHHEKHHGGYVSKVNDAIQGHGDLESKSIEDLMRGIDRVPQEIRTAVRNNGGGHANHSLFWQIMSPDGGGEPDGALAEEMRSVFGDFSSFRDDFKSTAVGQFGSGWAWLGLDGNGTLHLHGTPNQDTPLMEGHTPILGLDVWEHAYYLTYQNRRPDYVDAWWNVVNWGEVQARFERARG